MHGQSVVELRKRIENTHVLSICYQNMYILVTYALKMIDMHARPFKASKCIYYW